MKRTISILSLCFVMLFSIILLSACGMNDAEKNWRQEGAWTEIYVYKGKGELISMNWSESEKKGTATIKNTDSSYTQKYVELYEDDSNYISSTTGLPSNYSGNVEAFETRDGRLWVRIMWTDTSTFLLVTIYE